MASLAEALKDRKSFPDAQEVVIGDGLKITLGELRAHQEATGQDVAQQLAAERTKLADEQAKLTAAQQEVLNLWNKLQGEKPPVAAAAASSSAASDWTKDPFFAPVADYLHEKIESQLTTQKEQIAQFQRALGLGVKYIADTFSEMRYQALPEEFRKENPYDAVVKTAAERKFLDSGGIPDIRKVYDEWRTPRERDAERKKIETEAYDRARNDIMANSLARPSGMPVAPVANADPNAPHTIKESFAKLKEDPEFARMVYGLTGQA
jgi:hypothetical protein